MKPAELRGGHIGRSHFAARRCKAVYTTEETSHILGDMEGFLRFVYFILHALVYFFIILYSLSHFQGRNIDISYKIFLLRRRIGRLVSHTLGVIRVGRRITRHFLDL